MGKFIVIEGLDGAGKTTLATALAARIPNSVHVREPGGTPTAEAIRAIVKDGTLVGKETSIFGEILLMFAARSYLGSQIKNHLKEGHTVVCERWIHSTYIYQGVDDATVELIDSLIAQLDLPTPDLAVLIKAPERDVDARGEPDHLDIRSKSLDVEWDDPFWESLAEHTMVITRDATAEDICHEVGL